MSKQIQDIQTYAVARSKLLETLKVSLSKDDRFVAAWLTGSLARGNADVYSDIDITVVFSKETANLSTEWVDMSKQFGNIANVHESKQNAPKGGIMLTVLYATGITVDWLLVPGESGQRPKESVLLFEKTPIPIKGPLLNSSMQNDKNRLESRFGFFWMMASVAAKSVLRNDGVRFHVFLLMLRETAHEIKAGLAGKENIYQRDSGLKLEVRQKDQAEALLKLCDEVKSLGGAPSSSAHKTIQMLLELVV